MKTKPKIHTLWRCTQCPNGIYEVTDVIGDRVYFKNYHHDDTEQFDTIIQVFNFLYAPLSQDEAEAIILDKTGGIF